MEGIIAVLLAILGIVVAIVVPVAIERLKRPILSIERAEDANARDRTPSFRIVHAKVINRPLGGRTGKHLLTNVATSCRVEATFVSRSDGRSLTVPGRWSASPEPITFVFENHTIGAIVDPTKIPQSLRFDLSPDAGGEVLGLAIKAEGDPDAYAFTSQSYLAPDTLRHPDLKLPDEEYEVTVVARSGGIEARRRFTLYNQGSSSNGLRLSPDPSP